MGSDNNCSNYYNIEQGSITTSPYYQTLGSQNNLNQSAMKNTNNEWISQEQSSDASFQNQDSETESQRDQNMRSASEMSNSRTNKSYSHSAAAAQQHLQMSVPQWNFPVGNTYQRFYGDSHYGIVLTPNVSQQSSLVSTPSSSLHSLNSEIQSNNHLHVHQMQTNQHLKKIYFQGLKICSYLTCIFRKGNSDKQENLSQQNKV